MSRLTTGVHLVLCLLAGLGAAGVIRAVASRPRAAALASGVLIALAAVDMLRPGSLGLERPYRWTVHAVRPSDDAIAFYEALARQGNAGPILEFPADSTGPWIGRAPDHILLAAYHHRRTSACFGSYRPDRRALEAAARRLPERAALAELRRMGFTTMVFHEAGGPGAVKQRFDAQTRGPHPSLTRLLAAADRTAYAIAPAREEVRP